jgi:hypothetical protein
MLRLALLTERRSDTAEPRSNSENMLERTQHASAHLPQIHSYSYFAANPPNLKTTFDIGAGAGMRKSTSQCNAQGPPWLQSFAEHTVFRLLLTRYTTKRKTPCTHLFKDWIAAELVIYTPPPARSLIFRKRSTPDPSRVPPSLPTCSFHSSLVATPKPTHSPRSQLLALLYRHAPCLSLSLSLSLCVCVCLSLSLAGWLAGSLRKRTCCP